MSKGGFISGGILSADIAYRNGSTGVGAAGSAVVNTPAGVVDGDVLIASVRITGAAGIITPPAGWASRQSGTNGSRKFEVFSKVASGEPGSYTFTTNAGSSISVTIDAYSGVDNVTPMDTAATVGTGATSQVDWPAITTATAGALHVATVGGVGVPSAGGEPSGYIFRNQDANFTILSCDKSYASAGVISGIFAAGGGISWIAISLALRKA